MQCLLPHVIALSLITLVAAQQCVHTVGFGIDLRYCLSEPCDRDLDHEPGCGCMCLSS